MHSTTPPRAAHRSTPGRIEIVPYQRSWPGEFEAIAANLRRSVGKLALRIDHIGSTAIPAAAAKDVIDIQLTVPSLHPVEQIERALALAGYTRYAGVVADHRPPAYEGPDEEWHKLLFMPPPAQRPTNLHVRARGRANQRYALLFRDYLRAHPAVTRAYVSSKRRIAKYHADDRLTYVDIKDPVFDVIVAAAEEWAELVGWEPGPADA